jgi:hypothetical protein
MNSIDESLINLLELIKPINKGIVECNQASKNNEEISYFRLV